MGFGWNWLGLVLILSSWIQRGASADSIPLVTSEGRCQFVLNTPKAASQWMLIVGSLAAPDTRTRVHIRSEPCEGPEAIARVTVATTPAWRDSIRITQETLNRFRRSRVAPEEYPPLDNPPASKSFHLFAGDRDLTNPASYRLVRADLARVGKRCQAYVDREVANACALKATIDDAIRTFDEEVLPWTERNLGGVVDVDRDGRFTFLFTSLLAKLEKGRAPVDGFVRGSDFVRDMQAPFSNRCDMMYLNAALKPGPHLRTVIAHEYTHAVMFCEQNLVCATPLPTPHSEESWLNEGLAHLVEEMQGHSWSNLEDRVCAFLAQPERSPLLIADYFQTGRWREPGPRGWAFCFLRSAALRHGPDLPRQLIQSPFRGRENLEAATATPLPVLFREAAIELLRTDFPVSTANEHGRAQGLGGPRYHEVTLGCGNVELDLIGTGLAFFLLHAPVSERAKVTITAPVGADLQCTLVPLTAGQARFSIGPR
ncbi:MAG: hypothetical protein HY040_08745 [Planctomycetes bacterium]|nr:hypothetical protein [Planctomycetota bacterium]